MNFFYHHPQANKLLSAFILGSILAGGGGKGNSSPAETTARPVEMHARAPNMDMILRDMNNEGKKTWEVYTSKQVRSSGKTEQNIDQSLGWLKDNFEETALPGESTQMNLTSRYGHWKMFTQHIIPQAVFAPSLNAKKVPSE